MQTFMIIMVSILFIIIALVNSIDANKSIDDNRKVSKRKK